MTIRENIAAYIEGLANEKIPDHSLNLFEAGLLTSLDILDLISFIETTFHLSISDDDVSMDTFGSIDGITGLVEKKQKTS
jgi:methoxymalonate biosynthesis acyl carrier protein